jgi:hypothetical protein
MRRAWARRAFVDLMMKAPLLFSVLPAGLGACRTASPGAIAERQRACVKRVSYLMFPQPEVGDEPYERTVAGIFELVRRRPGLATLLAQGIEQLDDGQAGSWIALDELRQTARLREIEASPFFRWLYQATIDHLYNDERVWSHIGYEGSSFEKGGYRSRGFDDIDWL